MKVVCITATRLEAEERRQLGREATAILARALSQLTPRQREVMLTLYCDLDCQGDNQWAEGGRALGISEQACRQIHHRAMEVLRRRMARHALSDLLGGLVERPVLSRRRRAA